MDWSPPRRPAAFVGPCIPTATREPPAGASAFLYAFDLISLDGTDIRRLRLDARRDKLSQLLARPDGIRFSESLDGDGAVIFEHACRMGLEGHCQQTPRRLLPIGPVEGLVKDKESREPRYDAAGQG